MPAAKFALTTGVVYVRDGGTFTGPLTITSGPFTLSSGQFLAAPNADATAPGFSFIGDTNTGVGSTAADTLIGEAGGVSVWVATGANSGQLLVGPDITSSPMTSNTGLYAGRTGTATAGIAAFVIGEFTGTASVGSVQGLNANVYTTTGATGGLTSAATTGGGMRAGTYNVRHAGSGTVTYSSSLAGSIASTGTNSPITDSSVFTALTCSLTAGTTWASHTGLRVMGGSVSGTLTTRYGVRIDDLVGGTTRWAVSQEGASDGNRYAGETTLKYTTATPAAGSTAARVLFGTTAAFGIYYGSGAPTVVAAQGSIYIRSDGSGIANRLYVATDGAGTWTNFVSAA